MKRSIVLSVVLLGLAGVLLLSTMSPGREPTQSDRLYAQNIACGMRADMVWAAIVNRLSPCEEEAGPAAPDAAWIRSVAEEALADCRCTPWPLNGSLWVNGDVEAWRGSDPDVMLVMVHDEGDAVHAIPAAYFGISGKSEDLAIARGEAPDWAAMIDGCCELVIKNGEHVGWTDAEE